MSQTREVQQYKSRGCLLCVIAVLFAVIIIPTFLFWLSSLSRNIATDFYGGILCAILATPLVIAFMKLAKPKATPPENYAVKLYETNQYAPIKHFTPIFSTPNPYEINPYTSNQITPYLNDAQAPPIKPFIDESDISTAPAKRIIENIYISLLLLDRL